MNWPTLNPDDVKRRARQTGAFFLIGATVNVAVAWSCAVWAAPSNDMESWDSEVTRPGLAATWVGPPEGFPERGFESGTVYPRRAGAQRFHLAGWSEERVDYKDYEAAKASWDFDLDLIEAGWPLASFEGGLWRRKGMLAFDYDLYEPKRSIVIDPGSCGWDDDWTVIPLMPKWPGFLINTVFFGGIVVLLFRWASTLRRQVAKGACQESGVNTAAELS
jgi:hypothetical protein